MTGQRDLLTQLRTFAGAEKADRFLARLRAGFLGPFWVESLWSKFAEEAGLGDAGLEEALGLVSSHPTVQVVDTQDLIAEINLLALGGAYRELEEKSGQVCRDVCGHERFQAVAEADLSGYQTELRPLLRLAIEEAQTGASSAVFFEYDLDNQWASALYVCENSVELDHEGDWATDWTTRLLGPTLPTFAEVYLSYLGFDQSPEAQAMSIFLISRTVAAVGSALSKEVKPQVPVCMGFHDQTPITRLGWKQTKKKATKKKATKKKATKKNRR